MLNSSIHFTVWKSRAEVSPHGFCHIMVNFTEIPIKVSGKFAIQLLKTKENRDHLLSKYTTFSVKLTFLTPSIPHNDKNKGTNSTHIVVVSFILTLNSVY